MVLVLLLYLGWLPGYPADGFLVFLWLLLVSTAAALGAGLALACRHVAAAPGVLARAGVFLVPLSLWMLWSFESRRREVPQMLARADSSRSVVLGKNVFRNLVVLGRYPDDVGRLIAPWKREHARLSAGDTLVIYFERRAPYHLLDVAPAGPEILVTLHRLFWLWIVGGALLAGYGPLASRWMSKPLQTEHRSRAGEPVVGADAPRSST
jgi:hypothetical protein